MALPDRAWRAKNWLIAETGAMRVLCKMRRKQTVGISGRSRAPCPCGDWKPGRTLVRFNSISKQILLDFLEAMAITLPLAEASGEFSKTQRAYNCLLCQIRELKIPPGSPLHKNDIALECGVSRAPVSEAIARLASEGLVDVLRWSTRRSHKPFFIDMSQLPFYHDYAYDGVIGPHKESLGRLGIENVDILYVHDVGLF